MNKHSLILLGLVVLFITGGCVSYQASIKPPIGAICNFKAPLTTDFHNTDVGMATKKASIKKVGNYFKKLSVQELKEVSDIGPKVAESINNWFKDRHNEVLLEKLEKGGVEVTGYHEKTKGVFAGLNICLTGSLSSMSRPRAKELIENNGGHFNSDVTHKTNVVMVGSKPGSKVQKAKELKIEIWDEKKFLEKLKK